MRLNVQASATQKEDMEVKSDSFMQNIASKSPAQIDAWIEANVTSLASAKPVLKALAKAVNLLAKRDL